MLLVDPAGAPTQAAKVPSVAIAANMARRILVRWLRGGTVTGILEWVKSGVGFRARLHLTDHLAWHTPAGSGHPRGHQMPDCCRTDIYSCMNNGALWGRPVGW
ncbi:hypothetical protein GCM10009596_12990 [Arthrobacter rhombi]